MLAFAILQATVGLFCSSLCRRNMTAVVSTYGTVIVMLLFPYALGVAAGLVAGPVPGTAGTVMHFAFALKGPPWDFASNPVDIKIQ